MPPLHPLHAQLSNALLTRHNLPVSSAWLAEFLASRGTNALPPLPALTSTAHFRLLASDIRTSLSPTTPKNVFPEDVAGVDIKERRLEGTVIVQVLDVIDVGSSKWSQVEAIESVETGEEVRGREVIRTVAAVDSSTSTTTPTAPSTASTTTTKKLTTGPHRLLIQDARGTQVFAFESVKIPKIALSISASATTPTPILPLASATNASSANQQLQQQSLPPPPPPPQIDDPGMLIGCKLLLRPGASVRRGVVMLRPEDCVVLGGKVDAWDRKWKAERKAGLLALVVEGAGAG